MLDSLMQQVIPWLKDLYAFMGYGGVFLAMAIESACIPLPSEIVMPMAGWMVADGKFDLWLTTLAGTLGCTFGSVIAYAVGAYGGRPVLERWGKYVLIRTHEIDVADRWFSKYGDATVFFSRLLPVVRTFISFPAGVTRMPFLKFIIYTTLGSLPWCFGLTYAGRLLGDNWEEARVWLQRLDYPIIAIILLLVALFVYRRLRRPAQTEDSAEAL